MNDIQQMQAQPATMPTTTSAASMMMSLQELALRASMVSQIKQQIMKENVHWGKVPGCGDKPTLLKNGAELLCMAFKLASDTHADISDLGAGHREYTVTTTLMSNGELVATGIGSCSTMESKYRYRGSEMENTGKPVPKEYWASKDVNVLGGKGFAAKKDENGQWMIFRKGDKKLENPDIADTYNTVLKMASKRSLVDAVLKATGGSCEFTQDIEDMAQNSYQEQPQQTAHATAQQAAPAKAAQQAKPKAKPFSQACNEEIQRVGNEAFNKMLFSYGVVDIKGVYDLGKKKYEQFLADLARLPDFDPNAVSEEAEIVEPDSVAGDPFDDFN